MKGIYIASITENRSRDLGVFNKIKGQLNGFTENGVDMGWFLMRNNHIIYNDNPIFTVKKNKAIYFFEGVYKYLKQNSIDCDFVYIRYSIGNIFLLKLCKLLKKKGIKVVIELPTYPYEKELNKYGAVFGNLIKTVDRLVTSNLKKYVCNIVSFIDKETIFTIPNILIENGINVDEIKFTGFNKGQIINMISVANITNSHGYDRVINGLNEYYKDNPIREVYFHIVGDGDEVNNLKSLVAKYNLEKYVVFYGPKYEPELTEIFKSCNLGVTALGMYRKDLNCGSVLKAREYTARGIPFILGYDDASFKDAKFVINVPNDDSYINISKLIESFDNMEIKDIDIRNYTKNISWNYQIQKVLTEL